MDQLEIKQSAARKAAGWGAAKFAELKLRLEDSGQGALRLLESIEAVSLGIEGKLALWRALERVAQVAPDLKKLDYTRLIARAQEQRRTAEEMRLTAAQVALVPDTGSPRESSPKG
jgi:hypothetical protein